MGFLEKRLRPRLILVYLLAMALVVFATPTPAGLIGGAGLVALGEGVRIWATGHLCKNDQLTISGPYRYLRHPLYLGTLLIGSGLAVMGSNRVALLLLALFCAVFFVYYLPYKERIESARLEERYGDAFRRYATAVPELIPRLHPYMALGAETAQPTSWRLERFLENSEPGTGLVVVLGALALVVRWSLS